MSTRALLGCVLAVGTLAVAAAWIWSRRGGAVEGPPGVSSPPPSAASAGTPDAIAVDDLRRGGGDTDPQVPDRPGDRPSRPGASPGAPRADPVAAPEAAGTDPPRLQAALEGSLLLHESVDRSDVAVIVRMPDQPGEKRAYVAPDATFKLFSGVGGTADVIVRLEDDPDPLVVVGDVAVRPGAPRDPRLWGIDVRHVREVTLSVVDTAGAPVDAPIRLLVRRVVPGAAPRRSSRRPRAARGAGSASFLARDPTHEVTVWAPGYAQTGLEVGGDRQVVLDRAIRITVVAEIGDALDPETDFVQVALVPEGETSPAFAFRRRPEPAADGLPAVRPAGGWQRGEGEIRQVFEVSRPGSYDAVWHLRVVAPGSARMRTHRSVARTVEIDDLGGGDREVRFRVSKAELSAARQAAREVGAGR